MPFIDIIIIIIIIITKSIFKTPIEQLVTKRRSLSLNTGHDFNCIQNCL